MNETGVEPGDVLRYLERVLASTPFRQAERSAGLLRYLVDRSLNGSGDRLKEYTVGVEALGRGKEFDPRTDPIVRAEASRLRGRLERYYSGEGQPDAVVIELPKGAYAPRFYPRTIPADVPVEEVSPSAQRSFRRPIVWVALGTVAVLGAFAGGRWIARPSSHADASPMRLEWPIQSDEQLASDVGTDVVMAPDGSRVVFGSVDSLGTSHLRARRFDGSPPVDLPGTAGARGQFWSPDTRWIGFWAAGKLKKVAVDGGSPVVLCDASDLLGASWSDDGTIVAALSSSKQLWRVDGSSGGAPVAVLDLSAADAAPRWPQVLPGGKHVLYTAFSGVGVDQSNIEVASLSDGRRRVLVQGGTFGRYVAPDHLVFVNQGTLYAMRFDPARLEISGPKVLILENVSYSSTFGFAQISIAENGLAVYRPAPSSGQLIVARVDSTGRKTTLLDKPGRYDWPALSPDGERLALSVVESGVSGISVFTDLSSRPRLAWNDSGVASAAWTRDGHHLVARGGRGIVSLSASSGQARNLIENGTISVPWTFGPGDRLLAYAAVGSETMLDLWTVPIEKHGDTLRAGTATAIVRTRAIEAYPAISPDGLWLAYASGESGTPEIYVRALTDSTTKAVVASGGRVPRWSKAGSRLFFTTADQRVMVVDYTVARGKFVPGTPRQWTPVRLADSNVLANYDVGPNDRYIVALLSPQPRDAQAVNLVMLMQGLREELRRKVP